MEKLVGGWSSSLPVTVKKCQDLNPSRLAPSLCFTSVLSCITDRHMENAGHSPWHTVKRVSFLLHWPLAAILQECGQSGWMISACTPPPSIMISCPRRPGLACLEEGAGRRGRLASWTFPFSACWGWFLLMINRAKGALGVLGSWPLALLPPGSPTSARSQPLNHVWLACLECYLSSAGEKVGGLPCCPGHGQSMGCRELGCRAHPSLELRSAPESCLLDKAWIADKSGCSLENSQMLHLSYCRGKPVCKKPGQGGP